HTVRWSVHVSYVLSSTHFFSPLVFFFFYSSPHHRDLHSFPTRRSSDLNPGHRCVRSRRHGSAIGQESLWTRGEAPLWLTGNKVRSEEHTSELQSRVDLVCRLLLEKKKNKKKKKNTITHRTRTRTETR